MAEKDIEIDESELTDSGRTALKALRDTIKSLKAANVGLEAKVTEFIAGARESVLKGRGLTDKQLARVPADLVGEELTGWLDDVYGAPVEGAAPASPADSSVSAEAQTEATRQQALANGATPPAQANTFDARRSAAKSVVELAAINAEELAATVKS